MLAKLTGSAGSQSNASLALARSVAIVSASVAADERSADGRIRTASDVLAAETASRRKRSAGSA